MAISPLRLLGLFALSLPALAGEPGTVVLEVRGMTCSLCPITVRKALERVPGVIEAKAYFDTKRAEVKYDPEKTSPRALADAVNNAGFRAEVRQ